MASVISAGTTSTTALNLSGDTTGVLQLQTNGTTAAITIDTDQRAAFVAGTAALPSITTTGDTNTGIFFPAADTIAFTEGGVESMRIDSDGELGVGTTTPTARVHAYSATAMKQLTVDGTGAIKTGVNFASSGTTYGQIYFDNNSPYDMSVFQQYSTGSLRFGTNDTERMRITSGGNLLVGRSSSIFSNASFETAITDTNTSISSGNGAAISIQNLSTTNNTYSTIYFTNGSGGPDSAIYGLHEVGNGTGSGRQGSLVFATANLGGGVSERMRITSGGEVLIGTTTTSSSTAGTVLYGTTGASFTRSGGLLLSCNRLTNDGTLISFLQDNVEEGTISVSGTTVSYNGGNLSRWAQMLTKPELLKGTVMSNLDEMNEYVDAEGNSVANEQLNKVKVSDVEGDVNVAGVFVNWSYDEAHNVDEINMAMTGDMIIRIAEGVVVQKGDLLMSAGDGTAKPQGDDIVRSKTIAKVTSNHVTCTYADGSYCVPCVLMAC